MPSAPATFALKRRGPHTASMPGGRRLDALLHDPSLPMIRYWLRWLLRMALSVRVTGTVVAEGPRVYAANHPRAADALLLSLWLPTDAIVIVPKEDLRLRWLRWLLKLRPHLIAEMNDPASIKKVLRLIASGRSVALYPQGR